MISIVIPNYNGEQNLRQNLTKVLSFLEKSSFEHEVIIVDDASADESRAALEKFITHGSPFRVIYRKYNEGFPVTVDQGIRAAKGEIVFVIKSDAVPEKADYFSLLLEHFKDPEVFAVSAASKTSEGGGVEIRGKGKIVFFRGMFLHLRSHREYLEWLKTTRYGRKIVESLPSTRFANSALVQDSLTSKELNYSAWADGGSSAFRRDLYLKIGGFDAVYSPGYWEDVDLGYRAWKAGYMIKFEPKAVLLHDHEQGAFKKKYGNKLPLINLRNQIIFAWKNSDPKHYLLGDLWEPVNWLINLKNGNWSYFKAYFMACAKLPEIFSARIRQKKVSVLSDDVVLNKFANI